MRKFIIEQPYKWRIEFWQYQSAISISPVLRIINHNGKVREITDIISNDEISYLVKQLLEGKRLDYDDIGDMFGKQFAC